MAEELGFAPVQQNLVEVAALLRDIGKLAMPDEILLKPNALTEEEKTIARQHPLVGRDSLFEPANHFRRSKRPRRA